MEMVEMFRKPSAWLPVALSLVAFGTVLIHVATVGVVAQPVARQDEGAPARVFQALMTGAALLIGYFAIRWLPTAPKVGAAIVALQLVAAAVPIGTIIWLESAMA